MEKINFRVISLDSHPDKFSNFLVVNQDEYFNFQKFSAVDGVTLNREILIEKKIITPDLNYATGALGCAMSHLSLWHECVQSGEVLNICEDDAVFRHDLAFQMKDIFRQNPNFDIIYWGYNRDVNTAFEIPSLGECMAVFKQEAISNYDQLSSFRSSSNPFLLLRCLRIFGILCYSLSPNGAQKLIDSCLPLKPIVARDNWSNGLQFEQSFIFHNVGIDILMGVFFNKLLNAYLPFPPLAISLNTLGEPSTTQTPY